MRGTAYPSNIVLSVANHAGRCYHWSGPQWALIDSWKQLRQRMEFIMEDVTSRLEQTDKELKAFMKKYPENYLIDPQLSFLHRND